MGLSTPGIGSGLKIAEMVEAMVNADITPLQMRHDLKLDKVNTEISAVGQLKSYIANLQTSLASLSDLSQIYGLTSSVSDPEYLDAKTTAQAAKGTYQVKVNKLAQAHTLSSTPVPSTNTAIGSGTMTITFGTYNSDKTTFAANPSVKAATIEIPPGANTLAAIKDAINKSGSGVQASIIQDNSGYRLSITSSKTGEDCAMMITGGVTALNYDPTTIGASNLTQAVAAQNSEVEINGLTLTQGSNTLDTAISGVSVTLKKADSGKTLTLNVTDNKAQFTTLVNDFIKKYNDANTFLTNLTFYNAEEKKKGMFQGDTQFRNLKLGINQWATSRDDTAKGNIKALADLGIVSNVKTGALELNQTKFQKALDSNYKDIGEFFAKTATTTDPGVQLNKVSSTVKAGSYNINLTEYDPGVTLTGTIGGIAGNSTDGITMNGTDGLGGLSIKVISGSTGPRGKVVVKDGIAPKMNLFLDTFMKENGDLTLRSQKLNKGLTELSKVQADIKTKTISLEQRYKKKFNALDAVLSQLQSSSTALSQQLSALPTINSR